MVTLAMFAWMLVQITDSRMLLQQTIEDHYSTTINKRCSLSSSLSSDEIELEICVDTYGSAVAAIQGGADRLELCSALSEGGLTPTVGLLRQIKQYLSEHDPPKTIPVYCMIRCRRGSDFNYSEQEMKVMLLDLQLLAQNGADGFVFGALEPSSGKVHLKNCEQIVAAAGKLPLTFHRAIDCTDEQRLEENLNLVAQLGFSTVLTSGLKPTAEQGMDTIAKMKAIATDIEKVYYQQPFVSNKRQYTFKTVLGYW
ncbi:copper homeostasis protein cutC homolog [Anopheles marshallii]|uniref:copper homeostasis protein cutC homolog n=1 Tax=Anopheles marshallii TaxID=1521116 RepID=UPI00237C2A34|nr:copper homeostasis protein cutC homolog [Anopheles marshallii]